MYISSGETLVVRGTLDTSSGVVVSKVGQTTRANLLQDDTMAYPVFLPDLRVHDAISTFLPATAATDDLGVITGTFGTDASTVQTSDAKATTVTQYARLLFAIPPEFVLTETLTLRVRAGMVTTISDGTATLDAEVYVHDGDGDIGSDICATAAQSINSLTLAAKDFTITSTTPLNGDTLDIRLTIAITDTATATAVLGEIASVSVLCDIKG